MDVSLALDNMDLGTSDLTLTRPQFPSSSQSSFDSRHGKHGIVAKCESVEFLATLPADTRR